MCSRSDTLYLPRPKNMQYPGLAILTVKDDISKYLFCTTESGMIGMLITQFGMMN